MRTYAVYLMGTGSAHVVQLVVSAKTYKRALNLAMKHLPHFHSSRFRLESRE